MPAVSMDELAAFAESYNQRVRRTEGNQEPRRFERTGSRGPRGGSLHHSDNTSDDYYSKRRGNHEPLTDSERGWSYSPPRRRTHEEKIIPRLVCRTPGGSQKYDHSYLSSALERKSRSYDESGEHNETPSKLSTHSSQRGGTYYAWSPPSTFKAGQQQQQQQPPQQEEGEDTLPPYSERELNRGPSYRSSREPSSLNASDKKRKKEPKKTVRPCLTLLIQLGWAGITGRGMLFGVWADRTIQILTNLCHRNSAIPTVACGGRCTSICQPSLPSSAKKCLLALLWHLQATARKLCWIS